MPGGGGGVSVWVRGEGGGERWVNGGWGWSDGLDIVTCRGRGEGER